ncbi:MAG: Crp/Fnr family transcriptional regulator [Bacteroidetes bacterium]|nr:Crp/Fnr family transcriptional regulator [Bacteroidota bacterium]
MSEAPALDKISVLTKVPIFSTLESHDLKQIIAVTHHRHYPKDSVILIEEEEGHTMFIVMSGLVKISRISDEGKEVILAVMGEGDFFGELSLLDGHARSANVTVLQEADMLLIHRDDFLSLLREFPQIAIELLKVLAWRLRKSDTQIKSLSLKNAMGKVAGTIFRLAEDIGVQTDNSVVIPSLPTQQDLANMAGTSRETISRILQRLVAQKYVHKEGGRLTILDFARFKKDFL